ncbi:MAG: hypothetical protein WC331_09995 [Candidatus Omnitrophota bacterium]
MCRSLEKEEGGIVSMPGETQDPSSEQFVCTLSKVGSLKDYFSVEYGPKGECRPCRLRPMAELYLGVLEDEGEERHAEQLVKAYESGDILTIAEAMDTIKANVGEVVRQQLENLNCIGQMAETEESDDGDPASS